MLCSLAETLRIRTRTSGEPGELTGCLHARHAWKRPFHKDDVGPELRDWTERMLRVARVADGFEPVFLKQPTHCEPGCGASVAAKPRVLAAAPAGYGNLGVRRQTSTIAAKATRAYWAHPPFPLPGILRPRSIALSSPWPISSTAPRAILARRVVRDQAMEVDVPDNPHALTRSISLA